MQVRAVERDQASSAAARRVIDAARGILVPGSASGDDEHRDFGPAVGWSRTPPAAVKSTSSMFVHSGD
jgi:hypothetical protein